MRKLIIIRWVHPPSETVGLRRKEAWFCRLADKLYEPAYSLYWTIIERSLHQRLKGEDFKKIKYYEEALTERDERLKRPECQKAFKKWYQQIATCQSLLEANNLLAFLKLGLGWSESIFLFPYFQSRGAQPIKTENEKIYEKYKYHDKRGLDERDKIIAKNIKSSLKDGETGVLLVGADHNPEKFLPPDIKVEFLDEVEQATKLFDKYLVNLFRKDLGKLIRKKQMIEFFQSQLLKSEKLTKELIKAIQNKPELNPFKK